MYVSMRRHSDIDFMAISSLFCFLCSVSSTQSVAAARPGSAEDTEGRPWVSCCLFGWGFFFPFCAFIFEPRGGDLQSHHPSSLAGGGAPKSKVNKEQKAIKRALMTKLTRRFIATSKCRLFLFVLIKNGPQLSHHSTSSLFLFHVFFKP